MTNALTIDAAQGTPKGSQGGAGLKIESEADLCAFKRALQLPTLRAWLHGEHVCSHGFVRRWARFALQRPKDPVPTMTAPRSPKILTEAERAAALADLNAQWDRRLRTLDEPDARRRVDTFTLGPLRLNGRVRAGEIPLAELLDSAFSIDQADAWFGSPHKDLNGKTPREVCRASVQGERMVRAMLEDRTKLRLGLTDQAIVRAVWRAIDGEVDLRNDDVYTASWGVVEGRGSMTETAKQTLLARGQPEALVDVAALAGFQAYTRALRGVVDEDDDCQR